MVAMSGGVDSSVAAARLLRAGYDVVGAFLCLGGPAGEPVGERGGCCGPRDAADAKRVAAALGIHLEVLRLADAMGEIIDYFADEYAAGRTPNPCIHCNARLKFGRLMDYADRVGARCVATGHHARLVSGPAGPAIARARALGKDQSYALFAIPRERLGRVLLPIGELDDKAEVRRIARELGLAVHDKPDSQEICFVADDDYVSLLRARRPDALRPGRIVNSRGDLLGSHEGYARFTVGQRRGLGIGGLKEPLYVLRIDPATGDVTVGPRAEALGTRLTACGANWHANVPDEFDATVQVRYNHRGAPARVRVTGAGRFAVEFAEGVHAITPGQAAVAYDGDRLLGGGWIE